MLYSLDMHVRVVVKHPKLVQKKYIDMMRDRLQATLEVFIAHQTADTSA